MLPSLVCDLLWFALVAFVTHRVATRLCNKRARQELLCEACRSGRVEEARVLIASHGACPNAAPDGLWRPLAWACLDGQDGSVRMLLEHGADPNGQDEDDGSTALHFACQTGAAKCAQLLLDHGADPDNATQTGVTPLLTSVHYAHVHCARILLRHGADPNRRGSLTTPFVHACTHGAAVCAELLLEAGGRLRDVQLAGWNALHARAAMGHTEEAARLVDRGVYRVDERNSMGRTALYIACATGHHRTARALVERGANVNDNPPQGVTPMLAACASHRGSAECVELLLRHGADPSATRGPLYHACRNDKRDCVDLILRHCGTAVVKQRLVEHLVSWGHVACICVMLRRNVRMHTLRLARCDCATAESIACNTHLRKLRVGNAVSGEALRVLRLSASLRRVVAAGRVVAEGPFRKTFAPGACVRVLRRDSVWEIRAIGEDQTARLAPLKRGDTRKAALETSLLAPVSARWHIVFGAPHRGPEACLKVLAGGNEFSHRVRCAVDAYVG